MNKVWIDNIITYIFIYIIVISLRSYNSKNKYLQKNIKVTEQEEIVNVDDGKENFNEEINLQNDEHDNNINLDGVN